MYYTILGFEISQVYRTTVYRLSLCLCLHSYLFPSCITPYIFPEISETYLFVRQGQRPILIPIINWLKISLFFSNSQLSFLKEKFGSQKLSNGIKINNSVHTKRSNCSSSLCLPSFFLNYSRCSWLLEFWHNNFT